jgi:hypothetical protein
MLDARLPTCEDPEGSFQPWLFGWEQIVPLEITMPGQWLSLSVKACMVLAASTRIQIFADLASHRWLVRLRTWFFELNHSRELWAKMKTFNAHFTFSEYVQLVHR